MTKIERMMKEMGMLESNEPCFKALTVMQVADLGGFSPIPDLRPGDRLQWKSGAYKTATYPEVGQTIEVLETIPEIVNQEAGPLHREDFTFALLRDGSLLVFASDSRRFRRID